MDLRFVHLYRFNLYLNMDPIPLLGFILDLLLGSAQESGIPFRLECGSDFFWVQTSLSNVASKAAMKTLP